jgi:hypothetical protein
LSVSTECLAPPHTHKSGLFNISDERVTAFHFDCATERGDESFDIEAFRRRRQVSLRLGYHGGGRSALGSSRYTASDRHGMNTRN